MKNYRIIINEATNTAIPLELQSFNLQNVGQLQSNFKVIPEFQEWNDVVVATAGEVGSIKKKAFIGFGLV